MHHSRYEYTKAVIDANIPCLLIGGAGTGKTTTAIQVAEALGLKMHSITGTRQTSVNNLLGFVNVNGEYIPSQLRDAFEHGGVFILEEQNNMDPNTLICLNTMENGWLSFPDKIVTRHKDFRFVATSNPNDNVYSARSALDFSSEDRLLKITFIPDPDLELYLTSATTVTLMETARSFLKAQGSSIQATMRDAIRIEKLSSLGIIDNPVNEVLFHSDESLGELFSKKSEEILAKAKAAEAKAEEDKKTQHEMNTFSSFSKKVLGD